MIIKNKEPLQIIFTFLALKILKVTIKEAIQNNKIITKIIICNALSNLPQFTSR